ncbi:MULTISPECIES: hypothetical protein [unclassified Exiguobacterium]|uniref:hypothetical protein n=1 Tax=unclassified Exiguobacterium TaxID=2644629 RepID=UPI001BE5FFA3|nr:MULTISPECIES: hypothetical protein [unclassified Exiguobacterium]
MLIVISLLRSIATVFLFFNPIHPTPLETAEYFSSVDRNADSWESADFFESFGTDLPVDMDRNVLYTERITGWTEIEVGDETYEGLSSMTFDQPFKGTILHMEWGQDIPDVKEKVIVLPTTKFSYDNIEDAYTVDFTGEVLNDQEANAYLSLLASKGAAGYLITPYEDDPYGMGFVFTSSYMPLDGTGVDSDTAEQLKDGQSIKIEPYREEIPYIEFVQTGKSNQEIIIMSRLDSSWHGAHYLSAVGPSTVLYHLMQVMNEETPDYTIRYVFLNGNGDSREASDDFLERLMVQREKVDAVVMLDILGTGDGPLYVRTKGMKSYRILEQTPFDQLTVRSMGSSPGDAYDEEGLPYLMLSDSLEGSWQVFTEKDTFERLTEDGLADAVNWLHVWLTD